MTRGRPARIAIDCRKIADYGIGTYVRNLVRELAAVDGDEEFVLILRPENAHFAPASPRFHAIESDAPHYSIRELFSTARLLHRADVDLFHAPHYVVPFTRTPTVVTIHDIIHLQVPAATLPFGARKYARWMIGRATRKALRVIVPSEAVRTDLASAFPGVTPRLDVVPLGIDPVFLDEPTEAERAVVARCGLESHPFILYVGNDKAHKNLDRLIAGWRSAKGRPTDARLVFAGLPDQRFTDEEGVVQTGWLSGGELAALVRAARGIIQPSLLEGFGLPVVEAMACGTPAIVSNIPALVEVAGDAALQVDPSSEKAIGDAIVTLLRDDALHERLVALGTDRAAAFSWANTAMKTLAIYREVLRDIR